MGLVQLGNNGKTLNVDFSSQRLKTSPYTHPHNIYTIIIATICGSVPYNCVVHVELPRMDHDVPQYVVKESSLSGNGIYTPCKRAGGSVDDEVHMPLNPRIEDHYDDKAVDDKLSLHFFDQR